jgi:hypothetical protein
MTEQRDSREANWRATRKALYDADQATSDPELARTCALLAIAGALVDIAYSRRAATGYAPPVTR